MRGSGRVSGGLVKRHRRQWSVPQNRLVLMKLREHQVQACAASKRKYTLLLIFEEDVVNYTVEKTGIQYFQGLLRDILFLGLL